MEFHETPWKKWKVPWNSTELHGTMSMKRPWKSMKYFMMEDCGTFHGCSRNISLTPSCRTKANKWALNVLDIDAHEMCAWTSTDFQETFHSFPRSSMQVHEILHGVHEMFHGMFHGPPWSSMKYSMEFHGIPWNIPWSSMEFMKCSMECFMDLHGGSWNIPWNSMEVHEKFHKTFHGSP